MFWALNWPFLYQIGREIFRFLQWHALIYETAPFFEVEKKCTLDSLFGACTIASVTYMGACTGKLGNTVI